VAETPDPLQNVLVHCAFVPQGWPLARFPGENGHVVRSVQPSAARRRPFAHSSMSLAAFGASGVAIKSSQLCTVRSRGSGKTSAPGVHAVSYAMVAS
jgi:hypothetical protein